MSAINSIQRFSPTVQFTIASVIVVAAAISSAHAQWSLNGTKAYYKAGNVGIGTHNPAYALDVRSANDRAIFGLATGTAGANFGIFGQSNSSSGRGVYGLANAANGVNFGIYGKSNSPNGYAGFFAGNVGVTGWIASHGGEPVQFRCGANPVWRMEWVSSGGFQAPNLIGGHQSNTVSNDVMGAVIAGGGRNGDPNSVTAEFGTVSGGFSNSAGEHAVVGGGHYNNASGHGAVISGGNLNEASATGAVIGGGYENISSGTQSTVGGGYLNHATNNWATIAGGETNYAYGIYSAIGGGASNTATDNDCTIGGGVGNVAGNGGWNTTDSTHATVGGGSDNTASAFAATVGGGKLNLASAWYSTIPGGFQNEASGQFAFAAGRRAHAAHQGTFVWGDSTNADVTSAANNQFLARASGGVQFFNSVGVGVQLAPGGNSWSALSDRNVKTNITPINPCEVLARLVQIPITKWNLITQDESITHIGPMAQDFYAAFGVGEDDRRISQTDADGVALAAIQGLHGLVVEQQNQLRAKELQIAALTERLARLEKVLSPGLLE